jgi:hypothetical protein
MDDHPQERRQESTPQQPGGVGDRSRWREQDGRDPRCAGIFAIISLRKISRWVGEREGKVVVDETPIGNFCEIEGPSRWIDSTARKLGVSPADYITKNYATLFADWKQATKSPAREMTFKDVRKS